MVRKFGWGAACALATAAVIAGCSGKKKTVIQGGGSTGGDLNNNDQVGMSSIAAANLAPDGGAYTHNGQNFTALVCKFNTTSPASSNSSSADGSAMVVFLTNNGAATAPNGADRVWASHFSGTTFTPPQELTGEDRNETLGGITNIPSVVVVPLNTKNYKNGSGQAVNEVTTHSGNWVILWDAVTAKQTPGNLDPRVGPVAATPLAGPHRTLYYTLFVNSLRDKAQAQSGVLGQVGATLGALREYRYGFLHRGVEIPTHRGGASTLGAAANGIPGSGVAGGARHQRPAEDLISFAVATDTFRGCSTFSATNNAGTEPTPISTTNTLNSGGASLQSLNVLGTNSTAGTRGNVGSQVAGTARPGAASYQVGDDTGFIRLFYVQIASSRPGSTYTAGDFGDGLNSGQGGQRYVLFSTGFNLATLAWEAPTEVAFPTRRAGPLWAAQPLPNIRTYNQHAFVRYLDASIRGERAMNTGGNAGWQTEAGGVTQALAVYTVNNTGDGRNVILTNAAHDITLAGTGGRHVVTVAAANPASGINIGGAPALQASASANSGFQDTTSSPDEAVGFADVGGCCIFGADEGLTDTTVFAVAHANTFSTAVFSNNQTMEVRLIAAGVNADGTVVTGSPRIVTTHATQVLETRTTDGFDAGPISRRQSPIQAVVDSVVDYRCAMSRDGTYVVVAFRQLFGNTLGTQSGATGVALRAVAYKTLRQGAAALAFDQRFSTVREVSGVHGISPRGDIVNAPIHPAFANTGALTAIGGTGPGQRTLLAPVQGSGTAALNNLRGNFGATAAGDALTSTPVSLTAVPVVDYRFQDELGYACGTQSDVTKMSILWLLRDNTEDRVFVSQLTVDTKVTPPTITSTAEQEIDAASTVQGFGVLLPQQTTFDVITSATSLKSSFRFLPNSVTLGTDFRMVDLGTNATGAGGGTLIVFQKITDGTTSDGDFFDRQIISVTFEGAAVQNRLIVSRPIDENLQIANFGTTGVAVANSNGGILAPAAYNPATFGTALAAATPVTSLPKDGDFTRKPSFSADFIHLLFNAPSGDNGLSPSVGWARSFSVESRRSTQTASTPVAELWQPRVDTVVTSANLLNPVRLDRNLGSNVVFNDGWWSGKTMKIVFTQDRHLWSSSNSDGKATSWTRDSSTGQPTPGLVDNNTSADAAYVASCKKNVACQNLSGSFVIFTKNDVTGAGAPGDLRGFVRVQQ